MRIRGVFFAAVFASVSWVLSADAALAACPASLTGTSATFTCDAGADTLRFDQDGGLLRHDQFGGGFNSRFDFDSGTPGDQTLNANDSSTVISILLNVSGPDAIRIGTASAPAASLATAFAIVNTVDNTSTNNGSSVVIDDRGNTATVPFFFQTSNVVGPLAGLQVVFSGQGFGDGITLQTGTGADTVTVTGVGSFEARGPEPRIVTVTDGDTVNISSSIGPLGSLDGFERQLVNIEAAAPTNAVVNIGDPNDATNNVYTYTASQVTRGTALTETVVVTYANVTPPNLTAGSGNDAILVQTTAAGPNPTIDAGPGDDTVTISSPTGNLEGFNALPTIVGGDGVADLIVLDDSGDAELNIYELSGSSLTRAGFAGVTHDATTESFRLKGGGGTNLYDVAAITYRLEIIGGPSGDQVNMANGANLPGGTFNGAGGLNLLNYTAFTVPVTVNLGTGEATGFALVSNVFSVTGGSADDTLTGSAGVDGIGGGPGNDTLVGGPGNDFLTGQGQDDTFVWREGDGTDTLIGGLGSDTFQVVGSDAAADIIAIAASGADLAIARTAPAPFTQQAGPTQGIEQVLVQTLGGSDQVNVQSIPTGLRVVVLAGLQDDSITLDSNGAAAGGTVKGILGQLAVGGGGDTDTLSIVDADSAANSVATITAEQVGAANGDSLFGAGGRLTYNGIEALSLAFGGGNDVAKVTPSEATAYTLGGGPQPAGDTVDVSQAGATNPNVTGSSGSGQFTAANRQPVTFTAFESLLIDGASANGVIQFAAATYTVDEAAGTAVITFQRTGGTLGSVSATVTTSNGTATAPSDYATVQGIVGFDPGETSTTVAIPVALDAINEAPETVNLTLSGPQAGAVLGAQTSAILTITNAVPTTACAPRPRVQTQAAPDGNRLRVRVEATALSTGANNALSEIRFGPIDNARVTLNGQQVSAGQPVALPANAVAADFAVERVTPGQASTVRFTVVDGCGAWSSFVGGGTNAGF